MATHSDDKAVETVSAVGHLCGSKMADEKLFKVLRLNFIELHEEPFLCNDEGKIWDQRNVQRSHWFH
jgi:hypothetical protein